MTYTAFRAYTDVISLMSEPVTFTNASHPTSVFVQYRATMQLARTNAILTADGQMHVHHAMKRKNKT